MKQTCVGIVGYGYVGRAMHEFFKDHFRTIVYDPQYSIDQGFTQGGKFVDKETINEECDVAIVCVPTPRDKDGSCNLSIVNETFTWLDVSLIILKSTVDIGTTDRLIKETGKAIVFSPEFAGESTYWTPYKFHTDVKETPFFVFGGEPVDTKRALEYYMIIAGPTKVYRQVRPVEAEAMKYLINTFYALKIAFCYEMNEIFEHADVDYDVVRNLWLLDPRINPMHTSVFSRNVKPFGGKCFPKDVSALASFAAKNGYEAKLIDELIATNSRLGKIREAKIK